MLEELRENVLSLLEARVERAIDLIHRLREDKFALESEVNRLRNDVSQRDAKIQELEERNAELKHVEADLKGLQEQRERERQEVDREKAEVRNRLEGIMALLNSVDHKPEVQASEQPAPPEDAPKPEETNEQSGK